MTRSIARTTAASAVLILGSLAGCSSDDQASSDSAGSSDSGASNDSGGDSASDSGGDSGASDDSASGGGDYCEALADAKKQSEDLAASGADIGAGLQDSLDTLRELADKAPDEVSGEWQTIEDGFDSFEQAIEDEGLTIEEFFQAAQDPSQLPKDVDITTMQKLGAKLQQLNTPEVADAQKKIDAHAQQECRIDFSNDPGGAASQ